MKDNEIQQTRTEPEPDQNIIDNAAEKWRRRVRYACRQKMKRWREVRETNVTVPIPIPIWFLSYLLCHSQKKYWLWRSQR